MYIGWLDRTWTTAEVEIPSSTPEGKVEVAAIDALSVKLGLEGHGENVAFTGVYWKPCESTHR
jgi:hypothetical protein